MGIIQSIFGRRSKKAADRANKAAAQAQEDQARRQQQATQEQVAYNRQGLESSLASRGLGTTDVGGATSGAANESRSMFERASKRALEGAASDLNVATYSRRAAAAGRTYNRMFSALSFLDGVTNIADMAAGGSGNHGSSMDF